MKKLVTQALATAALGLVSHVAVAQDCNTTTPAPGVNWDCCQQKCGPGLYGSAGLMFLKRASNSDPAYHSFTCQYVDALPVSHFTTYHNFDEVKDVAFRGELGLANSCGVGVRGRWFRYESSASRALVDNDNGNLNGAANGQVDDFISAAPLGINIISAGNGANPSIFTTDQSVKIQMWDLEATKAINVCHLDLLFSAGVRFAHISQDYNASDTLTNTPEDPQFTPLTKILRSGHNLNAFGPTVSIEGRWPILCNLNIYGMHRWSFLCAKGRQNVDVAQLPDPQFTGDFLPRTAPNFGATDQRRYILPIGEVEVGAEFTTCIGSSELFLRGGLYGATWFGAGNSARANVRTEPANDNLGLYGITGSIGVRY